MNLTDTALCSAACAVQSAMLSALPEPEECPDYDASPGFERRMLRLLNDPAGYVKKMSRSLWQRAVHTAAIITVSLGLSLALACTISPNVRAAVKQWFMAIRHSDIVYYFIGETKDEALPRYIIANLPEGYVYSEENTVDDMRRVVYRNSDGQKLILKYSYTEEGSAFSVGTANMTVRDITVGTYKGKIFLSNDLSQGNAIFWINEEENLQFYIDAFANEFVLLHIAESVSLSKTEKP